MVIKKIIGCVFAVILTLGSLKTRSGASHSTFKKREVQKVTIDLQPFGDISQPSVDYVMRELKKVYPDVKLKKAIPLPQLAFYNGRKRYRADSLISYLGKQTQTGHVTIGLTRKDISTTYGNYKDWGVMGLGYCPGPACIVSTFRLSKKDLNVQLFKTCIHELGHTQGLNHCIVKTCFMRDAEGKNCTAEEKEFCPKCRAVLESKGWNLN